MQGSVLAGSPADLKEGTRKKHRLFIWVVVAALLITGCTIAYFVTRDKEPVKAADDSTIVLTVSTTPAHEKVIDRHLAVDGSISAWDPLAISAETSQLKVEKINVDEGSQVRKGQILAVLNSRILRAQLAEQKAHLFADQASMRKAIQPNRIEDLNTWRAALQQAEANLAQEEANLLRAKANATNSQENARRYTELVKVGAVSQMDAQTKFTDAKTTAADVAAAEKRVEAMKFGLRQAREKLEMAERGGRKEDIVISSSTLEETKARILQLEAEIDQTIIKAPTDGKIVRRDVHLGEISSAGKTMFTMVRDGRLELRALIPEVDLPKIKPGMAVKLTASGDDGAASVSGRVREISPAVDEKTRLGVARIDVPAAGSVLKPGLFFHADIDLGSQKALVVPSRAVLNRNEREVVFLFSDGKAIQRNVNVGEPLKGDEIEIISGLKPGEEVIVSGAGFMKDGDRVRVAPNPASIK